MDIHKRERERERGREGGRVSKRRGRSTAKLRTLSKPNRDRGPIPLPSIPCSVHYRRTHIPARTHRLGLSSTLPSNIGALVVRPKAFLTADSVAIHVCLYELKNPYRCVWWTFSKSIPNTTSRFNCELVTKRLLLLFAPLGATLMALGSVL